MSKMQLDTTSDPKLRGVLIKQREALLKQVDAIEEYLGIAKTSDIRRFAKEHGYYERNCDIMGDE
jgi:hypothetical protein